MSKTSLAHGQLKAFVERIERLEEEKKTIAADIKEVFLEAKGNGFDVKILRKIIAIRKLNAAEREEQEAMLDVYMVALGMIQDNLFEESVHDSPLPLVEPDAAAEFHPPATLGGLEGGQLKPSAQIGGIASVTVSKGAGGPPTDETEDAATTGIKFHTVKSTDPSELIPELPAFLDRRKPKHEYTAVDLLGAG